MKIFAASAAGVILAALAFLHPAPRPALSVVAETGSGKGVILSGVRVANAQSKGRSRGANLVVYVAGEVMKPGLYRVLPGARADDALRKAGGFSSTADRGGVNLAELVADGEEILVPKAGAIAPSAKKRKVRKSRSRKRISRALQVSLDLNAAGLSELAQLPGVGETLAARIVAYRNQNGPFASLDELADVSGMTQRRVDALSPYLIVR